MNIVALMYLCQRHTQFDGHVKCPNSVQIFVFWILQQFSCLQQIPIHYFRFYDYLIFILTQISIVILGLKQKTIVFKMHDICMPSEIIHSPDFIQNLRQSIFFNGQQSISRLAIGYYGAEATFSQYIFRRMQKGSPKYVKSWDFATVLSKLIVYWCL